MKLTKVQKAILLALGIDGKPIKGKFKLYAISGLIAYELGWKRTAKKLLEKAFEEVGFIKKHPKG